jgi:hypothetical protein
MNHDGDMIRIVKRRCAAIERGVIEVPLRRSELPDEFRKIVPVFLVPLNLALIDIDCFSSSARHSNQGLS